MASIGNNMKWTMSDTLREGLRAFFEKGLGATRVQELTALDAFALDGGQVIGVQYVDQARALTAEQLSSAPWLEFLTSDVPGAVARMDELGLGRIDYHDKQHVYFHAPGGLVFRLAPK